MNVNISRDLIPAFLSERKVIMILNKNNLNTTIHLINLLIKLNHIDSITIQNDKWEFVFFTNSDYDGSLLGIDYDDLTMGTEPEENVITVYVTGPQELVPFTVKEIDSIVIKTKDGEIL